MLAKGIELHQTKTPNVDIKTNNPEIERAYDYRDADSRLVFQVVRRKGKRFAQRRPTGDGGWAWNLVGVERLPYRLPELLNSNDHWVLIVEGEKDVDALRAIGLTSTCNPGGAGKWTDQFARYFVDRKVSIIPDNDDVGRQHAETVAANLQTRARCVRIVNLPDLPVKGDVSDWLKAGGNRQTLLKLVASASDWSASKPNTFGDWYSQALAGARGQPLANHANALSGLRNDPAWQGVLGFDEMSEQIIKLKPVPRFPPESLKPFDVPTPWTDQDDTIAQEWFQRAGFPTIALNTIQNAISQRARECEFHPLRDWLRSLKWDGVQRIDGCTSNEGEIVHPWLAQYFGCKDDAYIREVGRCFLVAAVARIFIPGCQVDHTLVLEGAQGIGKSSALRILAGDEYFSDSLPHIGTKDAAVHVRGKWFIEMPELAALSRAQIEEAKAYLSRREERFRPPYGRHEIRYKRQCIFVATTNLNDYLKDETGNRRFWPVRTHDIDLSSLRRESEQIWAEAVQLFDRKYPWHVTDSEILAMLTDQQAARYEADAWEDAIIAWLDDRKDSGHTLSEIMCGALRIENAQIDKAGQNRVKRILKTLNWEPGTRQGDRRPWVRKKSEA